MNSQTFQFITSPSKPIRHILRIYIAHVLSSQHGIDSFTSDTIDHIAIYIYKFLVSLLLNLKRLVNVQGRSIPNFLHLLYSCECDRYGISSLIAYLNKRSKKILGGVEVAGKIQIKRLIQKQQNLFDQEVPENLYPNIFSIPYNYTTKKQTENQPLPIYESPSSFTSKPPLYSYMTEQVRIEKCFTREKTARELVYADKEIRLALGQLRKERLLNSGETCSIPIKAQMIGSQKKNMNTNKKKFNFISYL